MKRKYLLTEKREFSMGTVSSEQTSLKGLWIPIESCEHKLSISAACMNISFQRREKENIVCDGV